MSLNELTVNNYNIYQSEPELGMHMHPLHPPPPPPSFPTYSLGVANTRPLLAKVTRKITCMYILAVFREQELILAAHDNCCLKASS